MRRSRSAGAVAELRRREELEQRLRRAEEKLAESADFGMRLVRELSQKREELECLKRESRMHEAAEDDCRREDGQRRATLMNVRQQRRDVQVQLDQLQEESAEKDRNIGSLRAEVEELRRALQQLRPPRASARSPLASPTPLSTPTPARRRGFTHTPSREGSRSLSLHSPPRRLFLCTSSAVQTSPLELRAGGRAGERAGGALYAQAMPAPAPAAGGRRAPAWASSPPTPARALSPGAVSASPPSSLAEQPAPSLAEELLRAGMTSGQMEALAMWRPEQQVSRGLGDAAAGGQRGTVHTESAGSRRSPVHAQQGAADPAPAAPGVRDAAAAGSRGSRRQQLEAERDFLVLLLAGMLGRGGSRLGTRT